MHDAHSTEIQESIDQQTPKEFLQMEKKQWFN
jgi:hypothetical protein